MEIKTKTRELNFESFMPNKAQFKRVLNKNKTLAGVIDKHEYVKVFGFRQLGRCVLNAFDESNSNEDEIVLGFMFRLDPLLGFTMTAHAWNRDKNGGWYDTTRSQYGDTTTFLVTVKSDILNESLKIWCKACISNNRSYAVFFKTIVNVFDENKVRDIDQRCNTYMPIQEIARSTPKDFLMVNIVLLLSGRYQPNYECGIDIDTYEKFQEHPKFHAILAKHVCKMFNLKLNMSFVDIGEKFIIL